MGFTYVYISIYLYIQKSAHPTFFYDSWNLHGTKLCDDVHEMYGLQIKYEIGVQFPILTFKIYIKNVLNAAGKQH